LLREVEGEEQAIGAVKTTAFIGKNCLIGKLEAAETGEMRPAIGAQNQKKKQTIYCSKGGMRLQQTSLEGTRGSKTNSQKHQCKKKEDVNEERKVTYYNN